MENNSNWGPIKKHLINSAKFSLKKKQFIYYESIDRESLFLGHFSK